MRKKYHSCWASAWLQTIICLCGLVEGSPGDAQVVLAGKGGDRRPQGALAVTRDIERRVVQAGGNTVGVLVASLSWTSADDLDLHMLLPGGQEISYRHKTAEGGELDVDMCVQGKHGGNCADRPVENIVFQDEPPAGRYKIFVQNFNYHLNTLPENMQVARMQEGRKASKDEMQLRLSQDRPVLFDLLLKVHGSKKLFEGLCTPAGKTHGSSDVIVLEFDYDPRKDEDERFIPHFEAVAAQECLRYSEKLALAGSEARALPGSPNEKTVQPRKADGKVKKAAGGGGGAKAKSNRAGKRAGQGREDAKHAALQAVRSSSPELLAAKPASVLWSLLSDLSATCKGCMEKAELVEKLLATADVRSEL
ncbi:unnamed protein product [Symbiodinium sp. CCMP2592]|nr:unnamed protein product [Symbiodinium sp. CCMP2592]